MMITQSPHSPNLGSLILSVFLLCYNPLTNAQAPTEHAVTPDGATWFAIRDLGSRPQPINPGTGSFLTFQSRNAGGIWGDWSYLNGGLLDMTPGKEQADLDLVIYIDGRPSGVALQGRVDGNNPAVFPIYDGEIDVGRAGSSFRNIYLSGEINLTKIALANCPLSVPKMVRENGCVKIRTGRVISYLPLYR